VPDAGIASAKTDWRRIVSLQVNSVLTTFVTNCYSLWTNWNGGGGPGPHAQLREGRTRNAIVAMSSFMFTPRVVFAAIPDWGGFAWDTWTLTLNNKYTNKNDIKYGKFVEYCSTIYHETRHAEQFYRVAQGLALGRLKYPDASDRQVVQSLGGAGLSIQQKIGLFGGGRGVQTSQLLPTASLLAEWLDIPAPAAQHAYNSRANFNVFAALPKPNWFQRSTILLEVEDWMRATYKKTFGEMDSFAQREDDGPGAIRDNVYRMYRNLPEEHDAHSIEDLVDAALKNRIGHPGSENQPRTNVGLFGA
jgi:hypothetical protein